MSAVFRLVDAWESVQVELRGRYSLSRLQQVLRHAERTRWWQHVGVMLLTPLPVLGLIVLMDILPLNPPEDGVLHQTIGLYLRVFLAMSILAYMITSQARESSPSLPLSTARHWWITLTIGLVCFGSFIGLGVLVGFPTPFVVHLMATPWIITWVVNLRAAWNDSFEKDGETKHKLVHYIKLVFSAQLAMFFVYSAFLVAFTSIRPEYQVYFTLVLPILKLSFKNWVIHGVKYMEDLAPTTVVFNVDVFHAIFVSSSMQSASSMGSVVVVMVIDAVQSMVAYHEVSKVLQAVNQLASKCIPDKKAAAGTDVIYLAQPRRISLRQGSIAYALNAIAANTRIRGHEDGALPSCRFVTKQHFASVSVLPTALDIPAHFGSTAQIPIPRGGGRIVPIRSAGQLRHEHLNQAEQAQLECVQGVLKMLHMIEFYVLVEFVEIVVPVVNAVSSRLRIYLPNRVYYKNLTHLSSEQMTAEADRVVVYAVMELLSLVVFCYLIDRQLQHTSTYQILAFVLHKHAKVAQTALTMWIFLIVQLALRHFGMDYSFRFEWLRGAKPAV